MTEITQEGNLIGTGTSKNPPIQQDQPKVIELVKPGLEKLNQYLVENPDFVFYSTLNVSFKGTVKTAL